MHLYKFGRDEKEFLVTRAYPVLRLWMKTRLPDADVDEAVWYTDMGQYSTLGGRGRELVSPAIRNHAKEKQVAKCYIVHRTSTNYLGQPKQRANIKYRTWIIV
jgi:hypothetical protein